MLKKASGFLILGMSLVACNNNVQALRTPNTPQLLNAASAPSTRAITDARYSYSADRTELLITLTHDNGETAEHSLVRRPLDGFAVVAQTTIKRNGSVVSSARTTPSEAQLVIKTAANNGWQDIYRDLKDRYRLAGLVN
ncbi:hypothetical protein COW36_23320 [bacterium (Candidatus Blackallbacteria) CG17_big_fil_post_rev_8_21_14_2_50_48_46]|uniref:Lipoprotein n=1 Tax=bacterium (Candidatus Blackallbacteria) CG17_big_fil_post_rev_8_21_14_2_50_48_46 TaxID=2014261 RepID=A0A2M7FXG3_9BACT|nr:MAG: hypothetical protein COW64_17535 [bacterium (Candidatus Blackallbacteria) CG18_big_fil_WC_8_21_14_2_50_49_26]PIW13974.1 MAG: hypothetical protein COW36_23320 [bacterium (Candidatus Blackallbacteria) CG17_big_fil_post_rev_8_21_14_2_50_48_46]PIW46825.1 MAG: hypothetical protein COW20_14500 [bacterium (Candidatus Blackallbacteria) CG13_big_fil_rev_8_21_14_2_50_49_14]